MTPIGTMVQPSISISSSAQMQVCIGTEPHAGPSSLQNPLHRSFKICGKSTRACRRTNLSVRAETAAIPLTENGRTSEEQFSANKVDTIRDALFTPLPGVGRANLNQKTSAKVTVVGVGNVGMACAQTILTEDLAGEIALVDVQADKLRGEMLDLQHAAAFLPRTKIQASTDYSVTAGSDICIVTAGARQRDGESRLSLVGRNASLMKSIIPQLVKYSPNTILLIVSNPVDIITSICWRISGLPPNRVIGSGTNLDSSRFRFLIGDALDVNSQNVHGYVVGEHGDSSVPLWSAVSIGGIPLLSFLESRGIPYSPADLSVIHHMVVDGAYEVIKLKGYTSWAIGYSTASLTRSILRNQRRIHPVSVLANGRYGIEQDVFLSLPSLLGSDGVLSVASMPLSDDERSQLQQSARTLWEVQKELSI